MSYQPIEIHKQPQKREHRKSEGLTDRVLMYTQRGCNGVSRMPTRDRYKQALKDFQLAKKAIREMEAAIREDMKCLPN